MAEVTASIHIDRKLIEAWVMGHRKQIPFAQSKAINEIAKDLKKRALPAGAKAAFDNPTNFTSSSATWFAEYSTKKNVEALVYPLDKREPYLRAHITGGERGVKKMEAAFEGAGVGSAPADQFFPTDFARRNNKGNVTKATISKIITEAEQGITGRGKHFIGKPANSTKPYGIYKRMARKIRPIYLPATSPMQYGRIYDIGGIADKVISQDYESLFSKHFAEAIRTAK